jgi:glycosyltransferase involved in cell wall biosynthesis
VTILTGMDDPDAIIPAYEVVPQPPSRGWRERIGTYAEQIGRTKPDLVYSISGKDELDVLRFLKFPRVRHISSLERHSFTDIPFWLRQMDGCLDAISANTPDVLDSIRGFGIKNFVGLNAPYSISPEFSRVPDLKPRLKSIAEICYVGRLESFLKRAHWLPEIISSCRDQGANLRWHIYGDGPCRSRITEEIARRGCASFVTLHGWADRAILIKKLQEHHIFFLCSRSEGLPVAMVEGMLCGHACVVPEVHAGISHALQGGGGWMYHAKNPRDGVKALLEATSDLSLLDQTGVLAQRQARRLFLNKEAELEHLERELMTLRHNGNVTDLPRASRFYAVKPHVSAFRRIKAVFGLGKEPCAG